MIYNGQGYTGRIFCDVVCGWFLFWFMDYCLINIVYVNLGGQFFNKTSLVEKLELFFAFGFMVDCSDWFWVWVYVVMFDDMFLLGCMWLIVMKCFGFGCLWLIVMKCL